VESKNLIDEIFIHFLFASVFKQDDKNSLDNLRIKPKKSQRKKKSFFGKRSKDAAYKLLNSLIRKSPLLFNSFLLKSMSPLMSLIKRHDGWNYSPPGSSERSQKYVGLRNLGCICYMNAMMQQFFMIPSFRYNLLCVDDKTPEDL
jgi:ubiquitin carboxyl-terminal hydrolase 34